MDGQKEVSNVIYQVKLPWLRRKNDTPHINLNSHKYMSVAKKIKGNLMWNFPLNACAKIES